MSEAVVEVGGQAVLGRQPTQTTPWLTERHGYDPTLLTADVSYFVVYTVDGKALILF